MAPSKRALRLSRSCERVSVAALNPEGFGVAQVDGVTVLIPGATTGDVVDARIVHVSPHKHPQQSPTAWAEITKVRRRGEDFVMPACPQAAPIRGRCGGCPLMHLTPAAQATWKRAQVQAALETVAPEVQATFHPSPQPWGYRNRAHFVAARSPTDGAPILGSYAPRSHDVVEMSGCRVVRPPIDSLSKNLAALLAEQQNLPIHPEPQGVRYVTLRASQDRQGCLVEWICTDLTAPWLPDLLRQTLTLPQVLGASASQNADPGNALHTQAPSLSVGESQVLEAVGALNIPLSTHAFFQLNTEVAQAMYARAAQAIDPALGQGVLWDLYCGAGALGLTAALTHNSAHLCGAEINAASIAAAQRLALQNNLGPGRALFAALDLGDSPLPPSWPAPDVVLVNPPRQGLDAPIRALLKTSSARQLVYLSCSPTTLARDLADLHAGGWRVVLAEAHDMLPQTKHVEALVVLHKYPSSPSL